MRRLMAFWRRPAAKRTRAKAPRRPLLSRVKRLGMLVVASLALVGAIGGLATWFVTSGHLSRVIDKGVANLIEISGTAGLRLEEIYVTGRGHTERDTLRAALGADVGTPLMGIDPEAARARVEVLPWVREAVVERHLPGTLFVHIQERSPLAIWQRDGEFVVVDGQGEVIPTARAEDFLGLLLIVGDDAPAQAANLMAVLATEPVLGRRVDGAVRVSGRRWNLRFDNGIDVRMPEEGLARAWRRLVAFERNNRLLARDISAVDLRFPNRLVVRPAKGVHLPTAYGGKDT